MQNYFYRFFPNSVLYKICRADLQSKLRTSSSASAEDLQKIYVWLGDIKPFKKSLTSIASVSEYLHELLVSFFVMLRCPNYRISSQKVTEFDYHFLEIFFYEETTLFLSDSLPVSAHTII